MLSSINIFDLELYFLNESFDWIILCALIEATVHFAS